MFGMTVLICDDDIEVRRLLGEKIKSYFDKKGIECSFRFFSDGAELIREYDQDVEVRKGVLLFLDIHMPKMNGIETAEALRKRKCDAKLVFLTAYKEYVFSCFRLETFRYLLKPLKQNELWETLDDFCDRMLKDKERLYLKFGDEVYSVAFDEIVYIEVMRGKIWIYPDTECVRWSGTLDSLESKLPCPPFFRIRRSYLINMSKVTSYNSNDVILAGKKLMISRYRYKAFREAFTAFINNRTGS